VLHRLNGRETATKLVSVPRSLLTVRDVAEHLSVSRATIYKLVDSGELPHLRVLNSIRVRQADLGAYIEELRGATDE